MFRIDSDVYDPYLQKWIGRIDRVCPKLSQQNAKSILKWHFIDHIKCILLIFLLYFQRNMENSCRINLIKPLISVLLGVGKCQDTLEPIILENEVCPQNSDAFESQPINLEVSKIDLIVLNKNFWKIKDSSYTYSCASCCSAASLDNITESETIDKWQFGNCFLNENGRFKNR